MFNYYNNLYNFYKKKKFKFSKRNKYDFKMFY